MIERETSALTQTADVDPATGGPPPGVALALLILRQRKFLVMIAIVGAAIGFAAAVIGGRRYTSTAIFISQAPEASSTQGLAAAASQFGIRVPTGSPGVWGPALYVELLHSHGLLERIARDSVVVTEEGNRLTSVMDLLRVGGDSPPERIDRAIRQLNSGVVVAAEDRKLTAVRLEVSTAWPSVSRAIADSLIDAVNDFNVLARRTQATAERTFLEGRVKEAEASVRSAEERLQSFLQKNRSGLTAPELQFERDRLQRAVTLQQQLLATLLQSLEDAKVRAVRDTPVVTVVERPNLPVFGQRGALARAGVGGLVALVVGLVLVIFVDWRQHAANDPDPSVRELLALLGGRSGRSRQL